MTGSDDTSHYQGALLEDINHKFDVILEYLAPLASLPRDVSQLKDDVSQLKTDVATIKLVVTGQSSQLKNHEGRITTLEQAA